MKIIAKPDSFLANLKQVTIGSSIPDFEIYRLLAIINQTTGTVIYATGDSSVGYTAYDPLNKEVTLQFDTTSMSNSDVLQIFYMAPDALGELVAVETENVVSGTPVGFYSTASSRTMMIINNASDTASRIRWRALGSVQPVSGLGAVIVPSTPAVMMPAMSIEVTALDGTADVTVMYFN